MSDKTIRSVALAGVIVGLNACAYLGAWHAAVGLLIGWVVGMAAGRSAR